VLEKDYGRITRHLEGKKKGGGGGSALGAVGQEEGKVEEKSAWSFEGARSGLYRCNGSVGAAGAGM
jgi:hypothetical protein